MNIAVDLARMNTQADFEVNFCPTDEQTEYAKEYLAESGLDSLIIAVTFPGKQRGIWTEGQTRKAVMDQSLPAIWVDRDSALHAFDTLIINYGTTAMFRVYKDGHVHLVDEA